ncbi:serine/threonine protein kinase [Pochonia chlamydosporia 170]|uniref:non-specific serine/threonine protein kinase n=1 Tax=Pochonia chlamydosporia 170 TaxID=1380566 RepID=A0A179FA15_METCM|nr:serine/threonine protein kinase [Pochonia chlamydosporia 170]OAQ62292.1 serine/threonine protein kinase [Pochonia chlamydosporia 170]
MECIRDKFVGGLVLDGRFETISPLNHGSFGMVFMAQDLMTNEIVAIKCLTKKAAPGEAGLEFAVDDKSEELALHSNLGSHDNIVNLLHSFETDAHVYLVMEFCSQGDLYEAIRNGHGPLQTEHVRQFMLQLVDAVTYIHSKGVYHRDIKPENIFLTQDGAVKLGDFGLATKDKWSYEMTVGSDRYMAPEQFDSAGAGYSPAEADIWAIGICLLNILFSRNPFTTPTEADPLFLDFSRDKQSLFDVFPAMSQDTYEVIVQCMNLDPRRRSLEGARDALLRVVSFTTEDESLDDFCGAEKATVASANREPLRTPSIQSPHIDNQTGAFPWAKALHASPHRQVRQLSAIPDNESYTEDLFSKSGETLDWCSASIQTPSMSSILGSQLDASMKSLAIKKPYRAGVSPAAGSLPITMAKPLTLSMSTVFGRRKDAVSKSWSDMWDEEEEEEQEEQMKALQELNSRTWSHESRSEAKKTDGQDAFPASQVTIKGDVDDDLVADGFFFQDTPTVKLVPSAMPRYSPPSKRFNYDKWAALGERRRGQSTIMEMDKLPGLKPRRQFGFGYKSYEAGVWDHSTYNNNNNFTSKNWGRDRSKECPWNRGRDCNWRRDQKRNDFGDVEWVGGW